MHNSYQERGGEDTVFETELEQLRSSGTNITSYRVSNDEIRNLRSSDLAIRTVWNRDQAAKLRGVIAEFSPNVVHVHNSFPLISPAVYYMAKRAGAATVQTLHNYRLLCPAATFHRAGRVCEDCLHAVAPWPSVRHGCYRGSRPASAVVAGMLTAHRVLGTYQHKVDLYIALTEFSRAKFIEGGLPPDRIVVKPNSLLSDPGVGDGAGGYALYVGRLSREKGLRTLLAAWEGIGDRIPLRIVGSGPLSDEVTHRAGQMQGVTTLGSLDREGVVREMKSASLLVIPSELYETFGMVAIEAFATGLPVVASRIGAIADVVADGQTGALFEPAKASDLRTRVLGLVESGNQLGNMRSAARAEYERRYTREVNLRELLRAYATAVHNAAIH